MSNIEYNRLPVHNVTLGTPETSVRTDPYINLAGCSAFKNDYIIYPPEVFEVLKRLGLTSETISAEDSILCCGGEAFFYAWVLRSQTGAVWCSVPTKDLVKMTAGSFTVIIYSTEDVTTDVEALLLRKEVNRIIKQGGRVIEVSNESSVYGKWIEK